MAFQDMVDFLDSAWHARDCIVPCMLGPVGIGKTAAVKQHAKNVGAGKIVTIIASQILPNEVSGITMPESETKSMQIYDHYRLSSLEDGDILFFDELLEADQYVLSACLTLIESRMMMSGKLLPDIQIIAAANPTVNAGAIRVNIRQRFMFRKFGIDNVDIRSYIHDRFGITLNNSIVYALKEDGDAYNILSPRSLTKLCEWMATADNEDSRLKIAEQIDKCWDSSIGQELYLRFQKAEAEKQKAEQKDAYSNALLTVLEEFEITADSSDVFALLTEIKEKDPDKWKEIEERLANIKVEDITES